MSFVLGLQGPCASFETACSASLFACHSALRALQSCECESHLVVGVNLMLLQETSIGLAIAGMTSPTGRSHTFDRRADGFARGEGVGTLCMEAGTKTVGVRGSAVRQDGRSASLTAPNGQAQQGLLRAALADGGTDANALALNEAHGTGTALGDPIEAGSLGAAVVTARRGDQALAFSGVKGNLAHSESIAGVAALLKLMIGLDCGAAAPNAQLRVLNPHVASRLRSAPLMLPTQPVVLPSESVGATGKAVRAGGVSSFGYSGTIVHAVLESVQPHATVAAQGALPATATTRPPLTYRRRSFPWFEPRVSASKVRRGIETTDAQIVGLLGCRKYG